MSTWHSNYCSCLLDHYREDNSDMFYINVIVWLVKSILVSCHLTFLSSDVTRNYDLDLDVLAVFTSEYTWTHTPCPTLFNTYKRAVLYLWCIHVFLIVDAMGCCSTEGVGRLQIKRLIWCGGLLSYQFSFVKLHENPNIMLQSELAVFVGSTKWLLQFMILVIILKIHMLILCVIWSIFE